MLTAWIQLCRCQICALPFVISFLLTFLYIPPKKFYHHCSHSVWLVVEVRTSKVISREKRLNVCNWNQRFWILLEESCWREWENKMPCKVGVSNASIPLMEFSDGQTIFNNTQRNVASVHVTLSTVFNLLLFITEIAWLNCLLSSANFSQYSPICEYIVCTELNLLCDFRTAIYELVAVFNNFKRDLFSDIKIIRTTYLKFYCSISMVNQLVRNIL